MFAKTNIYEYIMQSDKNTKQVLYYIERNRGGDGVGNIKKWSRNQVLGLIL